MEELMTVEEFAASIKAKYPQYADMDDLDLAQRMIEKYPVYKDQVDFGTVKKKDVTESVSEDGGSESSIRDYKADVPWSDENKSDAGKLLEAGFKEAYASALAIPTWANEKMLAIFADDEVLESLNKLPPEERHKAAAEAQALLNPLAGALSRVTEAEATKMFKEAERVRGLTEQYETSIGEDLANFDWLQAGERLGEQAIGTIPSFMQAALPVFGLASVGLTSAARKSRELQEEGEDISLRTMINADVTGTAEAALEKVSARLGKNAFRGFMKSVEGSAGELTGKAAAEYAKGLTRGFVKEGLEEGLTEAAQTFTDRAADALISGQEDAFVGVVSEMIDSFLIGAVSGGALGGIQQGGEVTAKRNKAKAEAAKPISDEEALAAVTKERVQQPKVEVTEEAKQYSEKLAKIKEENPEYWTVSEVTPEAAAAGTIITDRSGGALVKEDGDITGLYKNPTSKAKGVAKRLLKKAVEAGGVKLDNFDGYLTKIYKEAGFRVVGRMAFNEEYAPKDWNEARDGRPDVVAMVYDPENKMKIGRPKRFNKNQYSEMLEYRDNFLLSEKDQKKAAVQRKKVADQLSALEMIVQASDNTRTGELAGQAMQAAQTLSEVSPETEIAIYEDPEEYNAAIEALGIKDATGGVFDPNTNTIHINRELANNRTIAHETLHAVLSKAIKSDEGLQLATKQLMTALRPSLSKDLQKKLDSFAASYDQKVQNEEKLAELFSLLGDSYPALKPEQKSRIRRFLEAVARVLNIGGARGRISNEQAVQLMNTLSAKFKAGEAITQADLSPLQSKVIQRVKGTQQSARAQAARLRSKQETMEKFGLKDKPAYNVREIGEALERRTREVYQHVPRGEYGDQAVDILSDHMVEEVIFDIEANPKESAAGWYTEKYQAALDVIAEADPSLKEQDNRDLFTMFLAVTSDGQKVDKNFELAYRAYAEYKVNGQVDAGKFRAGDRTKSIQTNIKNINKLLSEKSIAEAKAYLIAEATVGEVKSQNKKYKSNFLKDELIPKSAAVFGEKLGMFYANLSGSTGYLTMDRWWSRTFNRYRGELIPTVVGLKNNPTDSKGKKIGLAAFKEMVGRPTMTDKAALNLTKKYAKSYADKNFKNGTDIEKAANTIYKKAFVELNDAPFNASDRSFMIKTVKEAQKKLKRRGYDMSVADIQAILWYFEKMLYIELGGRAPKGISYFEAAEKLRDNTKVDFNQPSILDDGVELSPEADLTMVADRIDAVNISSVSSKHTSKLQKADPLHKAKLIVRLARQNKIGMEAVKTYLKNAGYSDAEIRVVTAQGLTKVERQKLEDMLKAEGMTPDEAAELVDVIYQKSRDVFENDALTAQEKIHRFMESLNVAWVDRQGVAKNMLTRAGMDSVVDYIVTSQGASGYAKYRSQEVYDKVFSDLTSDERQLLDKIVFLERIIAIDESKENYQEILTDEEMEFAQLILHSGGLTKLSAEKALAGLLRKHGYDTYNKVYDRAQLVFDEYQKLLKDLRDGGVITPVAYESMKGVKYQRRLFEKFATDLDGQLMEGFDSGQGLADQVVKRLSTGSTAVQNMDSWYLFQDHANMVSRVTFMNRQNTAFAYEFEYQRDIVERLKRQPTLSKAEQKMVDAFEKVEAAILPNPVVGYSENGKPKFAMDGKDKRGYKPLHYWEKGEHKQLLMREDLHKSFTDANNTLMSSAMKETAMVFTGTAMVKTFATGNNPLFFITNLPRDFAFIMAFSKEYGPKGRFKAAKALNPLWVPMTAAKMLADLATGVRDVVHNREDYKIAMRYGLSMDFLALQGRHNQTDLNKLMGPGGRNFMQNASATAFGKWFNKQRKNIAKFNLASEAGFRMALFRKSVDQQLAGRNINDLGPGERDRIYTAAVRAAREITDFNQGGKWAKAFDTSIPYLNAAIQGTVAAEKVTRGRRVETFARVANLTAWSTAGLLATAFTWIKLNKDDEDEEIKNMTPAEVYFATLNTVSEYDLMNYYIIPLGTKDNQGNWQYERIAKQQTLSPIINAAEWMLRNQLASSHDIFYNQGDLATFVGKTMKKNLSPIDIERGVFSTVYSIPIVDAGMSWMYGIDPYTGDPLDWKKGDDLPEELEGIVDKNVEPFYKELGEFFGKSPVRMQATIEAIMTTPSTNPYIGLMYGAANGIGNADNFKKIATDMFVKGRRRVTKSGSEYNALSKVSQEYPKDVVDEMRRLIKLDDWTNNIAKSIKLGDPTAAQEALDKMAESTGEDAERIYKNIVKVMKKQDLSPLAYNMKYTKEPAVRAHKLAELYGNALLDGNRGEKENKILKELYDQKIVDDAIFKMYEERVKK